MSQKYRIKKLINLKLFNPPYRKPNIEIKRREKLTVHRIDTLTVSEERERERAENNRNICGI